jgi:type I restriction enzyme M protein
MPNGTTFRRGAERELRAAMVEAGIVERIVALPSGLFKHTGIGVTLWVLRASGSQQVLVVDGTHLGYRVGGTHRGLSRDDIDLLRSPEPHGCSRLVPLAELRQQDFDLTPSRYLAREPAPLGGTLTDRLNALERAERAAREADDRARAQLSRILGGGS